MAVSEGARDGCKSRRDRQREKEDSSRSFVQYSRQERKVYRKDDKQRVSTLADGVIGFAIGIDGEVLREWVLVGCLDSERRGWSRSRYQRRRLRFVYSRTLLSALLKLLA